jgi:hypothetical protein
MPRRQWLFIAAIVLLVALITGGQFRERARRTPKAPNANQPTYQSAENTAPKQKSNGIASWTTEHLDTFFAGVVAFFTAVLAISIIGLWTATLLIGRRQSEDTAANLALTKKVVEAATKSADASVRSATRPSVSSHSLTGVGRYKA